MNRIGVGERIRPQALAPMLCERLSQSFMRELEANGTRILSYRLQMSELVEEDVIEQEPADR